MFRKTSFVAIAVSILLACNVRAGVTDSNWVGGSEGYWGDLACWDPAVVPDNGPIDTFSVRISNANVVLGQGRIIDSLVTSGQVTLYSFMNVIDLIIHDGLSNYGELEIEDIRIRGDLTNAAGARIHVDDDLDVQQGSIRNSGTIFVIPNTRVWAENQFENSGILEMYGATCSSHQAFENKSTGVIKGYGAIHSDQALVNTGLVQSLGGSIGLHSDTSFENTGTLINRAGASLTVIVSVAEVNSVGTIEVNADGSVVFDCNLVNEPNAVIRLLGGTLAAETITQSAGATFEGFGGITGDVVIEANGVIDVNGPTNIVGDVSIAPNATLEIRDGTTLIRGHTTCNNGTIHMIGGRVICQGGLTNNNCNIIWEPGIYTNIADFNLDGTVNFKDFADFADTWLWRASWY